MFTEIDNKPFRKALFSFPFYKENIGEGTTNYLYNIVSVKAYQITDKKVKVVIETHLPGILIGKAGKQIQEIKEYMLMTLPYYDIEIDIQETKMFSDIYL